jgi:hypothetical protein
VRRGSGGKRPLHPGLRHVPSARFHGLPHCLDYILALASVEQFNANKIVIHETAHPKQPDMRPKRPELIGQHGSRYFGKLDIQQGDIDVDVFPRSQTEGVHGFAGVQHAVAGCRQHILNQE